MSCPAGLSSRSTIPYDLLVIFFGFGDEGVEGGTTYYFDDVYFGEAPCGQQRGGSRSASKRHGVPQPCQASTSVLRVAGAEAGAAATVVDAMGRQVWSGVIGRQRQPPRPAHR